MKTQTTYIRSALVVGVAMGVYSMTVLSVWAGPPVVVVPVPAPPPVVIVPPPPPVVVVQPPAPAITVEVGVPDAYVWDGVEFVGVVGGAYLYLGPGDVWLPFDNVREARFHDWERGHADWRAHVIVNERYRRDAHGHEFARPDGHDKDRDRDRDNHDQGHGNRDKDQGEGHDHGHH